MINLILPKNIYHDPDFGRKGKKVYFLAGPILGGGDWHKEAILELSKKDPGCYIACPARYDESHELYKYSLSDNSKEHSLGSFESQTSWERYYLKIASEKGTIIFWLPLEDVKNPRRNEGGSYARDTRAEIGRWSVRNALRPERWDQFFEMFVIGAEEGFDGIKQIKINLNEDNGCIWPLYSTLDETISKAVKNAYL